MPLIAVLSDIHGNLPALQAVLRDLDRAGADIIYSLGDAVGYGGSPNECVDLLRERGAVGVLGNHDAVAARIEQPDAFNPAAREAALWTADVLTPDNAAYLRGLPRQRVTAEGALLVHGAPDAPDRYLWSWREMMEQARALRRSGRADVGFFGHTHQPSLAGEIMVFARPPRSHQLDRGGAFLANPGSVGQPRDGDPTAAYLLWRPETREVEFRRVAYPVGLAQESIVRAGLQRWLAERLECGT